MYLRGISPSAAQRSERAHRRSGRIGTRLRELVLGDEQLTVCIKNIGQGDHASPIGFLRGISRSRQCSDLGEQLLLMSLELHK